MMKFTSSQRFCISFWLVILNLLVWVGKFAYGLYMDPIYATYFKKGITLDYIYPIHILGAACVYLAYFQILPISLVVICLLYFVPWFRKED